MENPEKYFRNINYKPRWEATSVALPSAMTPNAVFRATGVTEREFRRMNPSFRPVVFSQQRAIPAGYHINLPVSISADDALAALRRTAPPLPQRPAPVVAASSTSGARSRPATQRTPPTVVRNGEESYYTVARGDNLIAISRRLGVPMNELAEANNITNSSRIYVGQVLRIPGSATAETEVAATPVITERLVDTAKVVDTVKVADAAKAVDTAKVIDTTKAVAAAKIADTVAVIDTAKGVDTATVAVTVAKVADTTTIIDTATVADTASAVAVTEVVSDTASIIPEPVITIAAPAISDIAINIIPRYYDTSWVRARTVDKPDSVSKIAALADTSKSDAAIDTDTVKTAAVEILPPVATAIAIPTPEPVSPTGTLRKPSADTRFDANVYDLGVTVAADSKSVRVRVSVDETIGHFSEWMRVGAAAIRNANNMSPNASLQLGKMVTIPVPATRYIKRFETSRLQYHMAIEEDFFARYDVTDFEQRRVRSGDNLWKLCADAQIPMWLFKKFNRHVRYYDLRLGDNVWIPKTSPKDGGSHEVIDEFETIVTETDAEAE